MTPAACSTLSPDVSSSHVFCQQGVQPGTYPGPVAELPRTVSRLTYKHACVMSCNVYDTPRVVLCHMRRTPSLRCDASPLQRVLVETAASCFYSLSMSKQVTGIYARLFTWTIWSAVRHHGTQFTKLLNIQLETAGKGKEHAARCDCTHSCKLFGFGKTAAPSMKWGEEITQAAEIGVNMSQWRLQRNTSS